MATTVGLHPKRKWHLLLWQVKSTWYGSLSCKRLGVLCVKACVGGLHHQPSSGCSQLCRLLWGNQTVPTILWQRSPAGGTLDSFGSARSCRHRESERLYWGQRWVIIPFSMLTCLQSRSFNLPLVNALLTEAVSTGQDEVCLPVHADTALLLISQLLHSAWTHKQKTDNQSFSQKMICLRENKPPWLKMIPKNQTFTLLLQIQKCGTHQLSKLSKP